jgi:hypothetical protein
MLSQEVSELLLLFYARIEATPWLSVERRVCGKIVREQEQSDISGGDSDF